MNPKRRQPVYWTAWTRRALSAALLLLLAAACGPREAAPGSKQPVPVRFVRVVNPRLPAFDDHQVEIFLAEAQRFAQNQLGLTLQWIDLGAIPIEDFFRRYYPILFPENRMDDPFVVDILEPHPVHAPQLAQALLKNHTDNSFPSLRDFAVEALPAPWIEGIDDKESLFRLIAEFHLQELAELAALPSPSDPAVKLLDPNLPFHQYVYWDAAAERVRRFDLILTNQLLASAETIDASIHSSLRGGITTGFTERSRGIYGGTVVLSTYPVLGKEGPFVQMRGGFYKDEEAARILGAYSAHEFGHLFLHRGHPYDHPACVMNPAKSLRYREWYAEIEQTGRHPSCTLPHEAPLRDLFLGHRPLGERTASTALRLWDRFTGN
ncbi:MAG: hypothetical protein AB1405_09980 [Bdellovibrionota bacterium]